MGVVKSTIWFPSKSMDLTFHPDMIGHAPKHRRGSSSRRFPVVCAVPRMRVRGRFAGIMLPSVVGAGPPHHAWSVGSRVPISDGVLDLAVGTSERAASSRPRPGEGTSEDRDLPDPIRGSGQRVDGRAGGPDRPQGFRLLRRAVPGASSGTSCRRSTSGAARRRGDGRRPRRRASFRAAWRPACPRP